MKILRTLQNVVSVIIIIILIMMVKVKHHCHITGKYRDSAHKDCNCNPKWNCKIPVVFHNLKKLWFSSYYARTRQIQC